MNRGPLARAVNRGPLARAVNRGPLARTVNRRLLADAAAVALLLGAIAVQPRHACGAPAAAAAAETAAAPLLARADALCLAEAYRSAAELLERALADARATGDRGAESDALAALARTADAAGDARTAERRRAEALALARALGDRGRAARALSDAGAAAWARAEYATAESTLRRALAEQRAIGDRRGEALTLVRLGRIPFKQGRYNDALALYGKALALQERTGDRSGVAATEIAVGLVHLDRRAFAQAMAAFRRALAAAEQGGDLEQRVFALDHLAIGWMFQDAPGEARAPLSEALRLARTGGNRPLEMKVRHLVANVDRQAGPGHIHAAIAAYEELAAYCEGEGNLVEAAWNRARLAKAEATLGRLEDAKQSLREAIATWERIGQRRPAAFAYYDLARLHQRSGETGLALATYEQARVAQRAIALPYASLLLSDLALLEAERGRLDAARQLAAEAVAAADAVTNPEMRWIALFRAAKVARAAGRLEEARMSLAAALAVIETLRAGIEPSDEAKAGFMEDKQEAYAEAVDLLIASGRTDEALEVSERARARALLDLLGSATAAEFVGKDRGARAPAAGSAGAEGGRGRDAHVESAAFIRPPSMGEIRDQARRRRATILEYSTGRERSVVFAVSPRGLVRSATIAAGTLDLARRVAGLRRALAEDAASGRPPGARSVAWPMLRELYGLLVEPVAAALPAGSGGHLIVVPHGPLFLLPFACVLAPDGSYLVERFALSYTPSVGVLRDAAARRSGAPRRPRGLLAVGNPRGISRAGARDDASVLPELPGAEAEAHQVAALFAPGDAALLTGRAAREDRVRALAPGRAVLHIAAHAVVREDAPLASYLALAAAPPAGDGADDGASTGAGATPDTRSDGRLTAREVLDIPLDADLVVLSGCETGLGGVTGDGVSGLSRAFLHAGAASLVVSLWRVADVVGRDVMTRFERALQVDGQAAPDALRQAELATIDQLRRGALRDRAGRPLPESPLYWAPFVLVGEPDAARRAGRGAANRTRRGEPDAMTSRNRARGRPSR